MAVGVDAKVGGEAELRRRGFTLLEVVLSISLMIILLGMLFGFYRNSMMQREIGVAKTSEAHLARILLRQITEELRSAVGFAPGFGPGVIGERYEFTVQATALPDRVLFERRSVREEPLPGQHDIRQLRYFIAWDEEITDENGIPLALGLVRQELKTLRRYAVVQGDGAFDSEAFEGDEEEVEDAEESFRLQLYAPEIKYIEMRYYDGAQWHRDWHVNQGNALPQMIRVTLGFETQDQEDFDELGLDDEDVEFEDEHEVFPPRSYTAYVRLKQADTFFGSRITRAASDLAEGGI
jgi:hypothetical protein